MGKDREVSNAFVRIGAKNTDLKRGFKEAETVANATLGRMGRAMQSFGQTFAGRIGLPLAGGAAGLGATVAAAGKSADTTARQLRTLAIAVGEAGGNFDQTLNIADTFSARLQKMIGFTRAEGREMATLAAQFGIAGPRLEKFLRAGAGLAIRRDKEPIEGLQALIDTVFKGRTLEEFGVFVRGPTTQAVQRAGLQRGEGAFAGFEATGKPLPGSVLQRFSSQIGRTTEALAEFAFELVGDTRDVARGSGVGKRFRETVDAMAEVPGVFGAISRLFRTQAQAAQVFQPFGPVSDFVLSEFSQRFERQGAGMAGEVSRQRFDETALTDQERLNRGPLTERNQQLGDVAGGGDGFPDNFVERLDANTEAVNANTQELQREPSRPP